MSFIKKRFSSKTVGKSMAQVIHKYFGFNALRETVARLQSILLGRHLLLGAKSWQKTNLMFGSAGTGPWKVLSVKLDVV